MSLLILHHISFRIVVFAYTMLREKRKCHTDWGFVAQGEAERMDEWTRDHSA